eukprot:1159733-Pelagomonas_calceolata.AAC.1
MVVTQPYMLVNLCADGPSTLSVWHSQPAVVISWPPPATHASARGLYLTSFQQMQGVRQTLMSNDCNLLESTWVVQTEARMTDTL